MMTSRGQWSPFYHSLPVVQLLHQVSGNAVLFQHTHEEVAHAVVDGALAGNGSLFETIEGSGVVFIGYDELLGSSGIDLLSLAFVELLFSFSICVNPPYRLNSFSTAWFFSRTFSVEARRAASLSARVGSSTARIWTAKWRRWLRH